MKTQTDTDRIEKEITLKAPRAKVWQALTDAEQFSQWFGMKLEGPIASGRALKAEVTIKNYEHMKVVFHVERVEPESLFSYRWHPYPADSKVDYSQEPMTLVEFRLDAIPGGTRLRVVESGFDALPASRRADAFRANSGGWAEQLLNIQNHVAK